jgi:hypothetical protein
VWGGLDIEISADRLESLCLNESAFRLSRAKEKSLPPVLYLTKVTGGISKDGAVLS